MAPHWPKIQKFESRCGLVLFSVGLVQKHLVFRLRQTPEPRVGRQVDDRRAEDHDLQKKTLSGLVSFDLLPEFSLGTNFRVSQLWRFFFQNGWKEQTVTGRFQFPLHFSKKHSITITNCSIFNRNFTQNRLQTVYEWFYAHSKNHLLSLT